ncbi:putative cinnamyl-alcohol dehydrogenase [Rosa chinensis]|uniref:Putative cinnamyl-alcohol dehydrogenase n=1 Tax=Rosa chinensis TaxID=74649 RepID=A0A2P6RPR4_ROSCH|nr:putative cinnamyl-alcohol dehydrogenase [Rosa chinensis]
MDLGFEFGVRQIFSPKIFLGTTMHKCKKYHSVLSSTDVRRREYLEREQASSGLLAMITRAAMDKMDGIIDTVSAPHSLLPLIDLLKMDGKLIVLIAGSAIGGMKETQEMVDFAAKHNITADVEVFQWIT